MRILVPTLILIFSLTGCGSGSGSNQNSVSSGSSMSASEVVAGSVSGALGGSDTGATISGFHLLPLLINKAYATNACPIVATTAAGSGCTDVGASAAYLTYAGCSFGSSLATWTGGMQVSTYNATSSGSAVQCNATLPTPVATSGSAYIVRQFGSYLGSTFTAGTVTRVGVDGRTITIDNASTNLSNYDNQPLSSYAINGQYGAGVSFSSATGHPRNGVAIGERIYGTLFDHTIVGQIQVTESTVGGHLNWAISNGSTMTVFHNKLKVTGNVTFSGLTFAANCAGPISGTITTAFVAGQNVSPTTAGQALVGHSETLTISSCGNMTLTSVGGATSNPTAASL